MITVHHLNNSRSQRVLWLLEELELPYEIKKYQRDSVTNLAPPELRAVHPLGKSPVITDDGVVVAESGAIMEYLVGKYGDGRLIPKPGTDARLRYTYWMHYAEGSAMPPLLLKLIFDMIEKKSPFFVRPIARAISGQVKAGFILPQIKTHFDYIEAELAKAPWFAGDEITSADLQMSFPLEAAAERGEILTGRPNIAHFLHRIHSRPAYKRALERGGPYQYAK